MRRTELKEEIQKQMLALGLVADQVILDGKLHRCGTVDRPRSRNGWYIVFSDPPAGGIFGDWRSGHTTKWASCRNSNPLSSAERVLLNGRYEAARKERLATEAERQAKAQDRAKRLLKGSVPAKPEHPYLQLKQVKPLGFLRQLGRTLVVPIVDESGKVTSLQFISPNGDKKFLAGGKIKGGYFRIQGSNSLIHVCEGYATGATVHEATGSTVLCALNAGNLEPVAKLARQKFPQTRIVVAADNDHKTASNPGLKKGREAAQSANAELAWPEFPMGSNDTDFNDLMITQGVDAVKKRLEGGKQMHLNSLFSQPTPKKPRKTVYTWPEKLAPEALHGPAGDFVKLVEPHSEADQVALLGQFLTGFGNLTGRNTFFQVEADRHFLNINVALVGETSKGRKGTSWGHVRNLLVEHETEWSRRIMSGLSSGEGLIWQVRDPITKIEPVRKNRIITGYQEVQIDPGVDDKRVLVLEAELASTLRVLGRDGNTLSALIRQAWDTGDLRTLTKNSPAVATGAHISIVGHITRDELRRYLDKTEAANGFANRFIWLCTKRARLLPEGGRIHEVDFSDLLFKLEKAVRFASEPRQLERDDEARKIWMEVYPALSEGKSGLLGAVIGRAEAQVLRLSCLYAVLDCSELICKEHLLAALAFWEYAEASARYIFGDALGDPLADQILSLLRKSSGGMTRTEINHQFHRHKASEQIQRALDILQRENLAYVKKQVSDGRPVERWFSASIAK